MEYPFFSWKMFDPRAFYLHILDQMKFIRRDAKQPGMIYHFAPNRLSEAMGKANTTTCLLRATPLVPATSVVCSGD